MITFPLAVDVVVGENNNNNNKSVGRKTIAR